MVSNGFLSMALGPLIGELYCQESIIYNNNIICLDIINPFIFYILGLVHDKTNGYVMALHFTSALSVTCIILWIGYRICSPNAWSNKEKNDNGNMKEEV